MENEPLSTVWSQFRLPEELCSEILSRLPVKSLLRFRCVSKPWLSLINDPAFCHLHLNNFKNNRDETHLLAFQTSPNCCVVRCSETFEINTETISTLPPMCHEGCWEIKYPVNGLVLLKSFELVNSVWKTDIVVWNPSIRKFHVIPSLPEIEISANSPFEDAEIGLGYDALVKDYKYVKVICVDGGNVHSVAVYTLGAGSWKIIQFQGKGFSNWRWYDPRYIDDENTVYLRGSLYTIAMNKETHVSELVSIDLSSEVFSYTSMPYNAYISSSDEGHSHGDLSLVDGGCTLAVFDFKVDLCMWVLEVESMCLTKRYSIDLNVRKFFYLKKNWDMLMWFGYGKSSARLASDEELVQWWHLFSLYNLETKKGNIMWKIKIPSLRTEISDVCAYIESLILLK